jgi:transcriptional regulator with XRE-family HTH domain
MDRLYKLFGQKVKKIRERKGLSQAVVAREIGLSRTSITNIERGHQHISLHLLYELGRVLGVEIMDLLPERAELIEKGSIAQKVEKAAAPLPEGTGEWVQSFLSNDENGRENHAETTDQIESR